MPRTRLTDPEIEQALSTVSWRRDGDRITRSFQLADFRAAMAFVNRVADVAEQLDHHPDISISWNRVGLAVTTHDSGGLTARDFDLARAVDSLEAES